MRLSVRTEELRGVAQGLRSASQEVARLGPGLSGRRAEVGAWALGRGATQADAFLATLLDGVVSAAHDLDDLALRTSVSAQDYDTAESSAVPRPR